MPEHLTTAAHCITCGPLPADSPAAADRASAKHTRDTKHATAVVTERRQEESK